MTRDVFGMVPRLGEFFAARNGTLLDVDMGLGEYTYIYVMAYHDDLQPGDDEDRGVMFGNEGLNRRVHGAVTEMLRHQLTASMRSSAPIRRPATSPGCGTTLPERSRG